MRGGGRRERPRAGCAGPTPALRATAQAARTPASKHLLESTVENILAAQDADVDAHGDNAGGIRDPDQILLGRHRQGSAGEPAEGCEIFGSERVMVAKPPHAGDLAAQRAHRLQQALRSGNPGEEEDALAAQIGIGVVRALDGGKGAQLGGAWIARKLAAGQPDEAVPDPAKRGYG